MSSHSNTRCSNTPLTMPASNTTANASVISDTIVKMVALDDGEVETVHRKVINKLDRIIEVADSAKYRDLPLSYIDVRLYEFHMYLKALGEDSSISEWMDRCDSLCDTNTDNKKVERVFNHGCMFIRIEYVLGILKDAPRIKEYGNTIKVKKGDNIESVTVSSIENPLLHCLLNLKMTIEIMEKSWLEADFMVGDKNFEDIEDDEEKKEVHLGPNVLIDEKPLVIACSWAYDKDSTTYDLINNDRCVLDFFIEQKREVIFYPVAYLPSKEIKTYFVHADASLQTKDIKQRMTRTTSLETCHVNNGEKVTMFNPKFRRVYSVLLVK